MPSLKPDADQIKHFLSNLAGKEWIKRSERGWWPRYLFHYTHIDNAASIFQDGHLLSRTEAEDSQKLSISSGSSAILAGTNPFIKSCVRLYFRPQTPTQFHAEGVRSEITLSKSKFPDAHCPVPVFFLFDSAQVLSRDDCKFSDGGLGSPRAKLLSTADDLAGLPWQQIYHVGWFDSHQKDITFRRSAEVVINGSLSLNSLRYVFCRSEAEKETLLHLLNPLLRDKYRNKITSTSRNNLFFRKHTFVLTARLFSEYAQLEFSPDTASPGPYKLKIDLEAGTQRRTREQVNFIANSILRIPFARHLSSYTIRVHLDEHLVYTGTFEDVDIPF